MQVGDKVRVIGTEITGTILSINEDNAEADVKLDHESGQGRTTFFFLDQLEVVE